MRFLLILLFPLAAQANPYIEYKNDIPWDDTDRKPVLNNLRGGYQWDNFYAEAGAYQRSSDQGVSSELGYKFNFHENIQLKGKWEGYWTHDNVHKLETELRYTF